jgi:hypothetical protein
MAPTGVSGTWARWEREDAAKSPSQRLANAAQRHAIHNDVMAARLARPSVRVPLSQTGTDGGSIT